MSDKTIVIDASVALKWWLRDEDSTAEADQIQTDLLCGDLNLVAPALFDYEIVNTLKMAFVRSRIDESYALSAISDLVAYDIERHDTRSLQPLAFQLACRYQRSVYDAAYLALAQTLGFDFYTGDKRLFNSVGAVFKWVKWIGDYPV
ncbi:MAG: type II toxin-antitoxin system VapC family toxin [Acidobacteria bacterium]|nr:type II toxin-antitoxin system VapC family toxin [Acidobacteriota bacterium]